MILASFRICRGLTACILAAASICANASPNPPAAADAKAAAPAAPAPAPAAGADQASKTCKQMNFFSGLTTSGSSTGVESLKITSFSAYTQDPATTTDNYTSINFRLSNAITTGTNSTKVELLNQESGLYNFYVSFIGLRDYGNSNCDTDPTVNARHFSNDRYYFLKNLFLGPKGAKQAVANSSVSESKTDTLGVFFSNGLGFRGLSATSTTTSGSNSSTSTINGSYGTAYAGFGVDGRVYGAASDSGTPGGYMSLQSYYSWTKMNHDITSTLFPAASASHYSTFGTKFEWYVLNQLAVRLEYAKALSAFGKANLGDMVSVNIAWTTAASSK